MAFQDYFNGLYSYKRTFPNQIPHPPILEQAHQCLRASKAPTKDEIWEAYYTNAKLDKGHYRLTPLMILEAVNAQTGLDCTRVYIRKDNGKRCQVEVVCRPIKGFGTFFGFGYIDVIEGVNFGGLAKRKTWYLVTHDPLYDGSKFVSTAFYLWYDSPLAVESGWSNG